jgi:glycosyltransferase involved in cell wall biosynthesis
MNKNKVAVISSSLGIGGAERFGALLSIMLEKLDFEVHSVIINDDVDYEYGGKLYNLGALCNSSFFVFKKLKKGFLLSRYLSENNIEIIIDNRPRNNLIRDLISDIIFGNRKKLFIIHSFKLENYLPKSIFFANFLYKKAHKIICVSHAIEERVKQKYKFKNTITIFNPFDFSKVEKSETSCFTREYVLFFGRLDNKIKNFDLMLDAFKFSKIFEKGYDLLIMGSGPDLEWIQNKIDILQINSNVIIIPFNKNPFEYVRQAKFTILTSHYEGFPMSIVESLALGTPVISVDCKSGPSEIILHKENGLLIENYNIEAFACAMNTMIEDKELYLNCKKNASKSVEHLALTTISKQWESIIL